MSKTAIVTDSTADIPKELATQYQIHIVPNIVVIDGQSLEDGKDLSRREFYDNLPLMKTNPTTSTSSPGVYQQLYGDILKRGADQIVSIHASSQLSGIFNAASLGAQAFGDQVKVIDSENLSLGLGFQVLAAAQAALTQPLDGILSVVKDVRSRARLVAMLDTLEYVHRSGRVSWARAQIGALLRIKPFLEIKDGVVLSIGKARTRKNGIQRLRKMLLDLGPLEQLAILHSNAEADARELLTDMTPRVPTRPLLVYVTTVIGTHVGPNGLGFVAIVN
ncbi:MAG: DegV family protein [Anaerolineales bacterium]|nr:DegV family protein [Anaerolineales bacterium]